MLSVLGGVLQWRQNTEKIAIRGSILSLTNIAKIQLFHVAYFCGAKTLGKLPWGVAHFPSEMLLQYCSYRSPTSAEKKPLQNGPSGGHTSPKNHGNMPLSWGILPWQKARKHAWFFIPENTMEIWHFWGEMAAILDCSNCAADP
jgi:hypothetical protein